MTDPVRPKPPPTEEELRLRRLGVAPFIEPGDQLVQLPAKQSKRLTVLQHIVDRSFQPDAVLREAEVNEVLARWCEGGQTDHVTVRRYLVDYGFLTRDNGVYAVSP